MKSIMTVAAILAALMFAGCGQPAETANEAGAAATDGEAAAADISVGQFQLVLPAVAGRPGALYGTISGGSADDRLTAIRIEGARVELHETVRESGRMTMLERPFFTVPAGQDLVLEPGGRHAMVFDLPATLAPGLSLDAALIFDVAGRVALSVETIPTGTYGISLGTGRPENR